MIDEMIAKKVICDIGQLENTHNSKCIAFDLDMTIISSVFTNDIPNDKMLFYKKSVSENRYSILRPGIVELLHKLNEDNYSIMLITDASSKRACTILKQFEIDTFFEYIISREFLSEIEIMTGLSRRIKPQYIIGYECLIDDLEQTILFNGERCIGIIPFECEYKHMDLKIKGIIPQFLDYKVACEKEKNYVLSWYEDIILRKEKLIQSSYKD